MRGSDFVIITHELGVLFSLFCMSLFCLFCINIWAVPCENVSSGIYGQHRPRSACTSAQPDQDLYCPLTESLDSTG